MAPSEAVLDRKLTAHLFCCKASASYVAEVRMDRQLHFGTVFSISSQSTPPSNVVVAPQVLEAGPLWWPSGVAGSCDLAAFHSVRISVLGPGMLTGLGWLGRWCCRNLPVMCSSNEFLSFPRGESQLLFVIIIRKADKSLSITSKGSKQISCRPRSAIRNSRAAFFLPRVNTTLQVCCTENSKRELQ